jgi:hypothetical protein
MESNGGHRCRPGRARVRRAGTLALAAAALGAGCGGEGTASLPVPEDCLASWNAEEDSLKFGRHVYHEHQSRRGQLTMLEPDRGALNIRGSETCSMVFAVPEHDEEYGDVGLVVTRFGWASMRELARGNPARMNEIQREAGLEANVTLFPDGSVEPL